MRRLAKSASASASDDRVCRRRGAVAVGVATTLAINWLKWGSPLHFGYRGREQFSTNALVGLAGLLVSPGKGLLVLAPLCLLPVPYIKTICHEGRQEARHLIALTAIYLGIYDSWHCWWD